jgi:hypothetical protein
LQRSLHTIFIWVLKGILLCALSIQASDLKIVSLKGPSELSRDGGVRFKAARSGMNLQSSDQIRLGPDSELKLKNTQNIQFTLEGPALLSLDTLSESATASLQVLTLKQGLLRYWVPRQNLENKTRIKSPQALAIVESGSGLVLCNYREAEFFLESGKLDLFHLVSLNHGQLGPLQRAFMIHGEFQYESLSDANLLEQKVQESYSRIVAPANNLASATTNRPIEPEYLKALLQENHALKDSLRVYQNQWRALQFQKKYKEGAK